ncbi:hypothetical protein OG824_13680 [Streptomyces prunicolor]|uniref:hypothetical protein n=1 Tax=Streptomyces prunicolor TaxID=67348 RepID=UPI0022562D53|nr:hypothetical protein [Streptomyces prunicolor]MCX5236251.1 hypothetical protein [Streptomyces prunicolor]
MDDEAYDFHIDAKPGYQSSLMRHVLLVAEYQELDVLDEDEGDPEILEDGTIRIYLTPKAEPYRHLTLVAA